MHKLAQTQTTLMWLLAYGPWNELPWSVLSEYKLSFVKLRSHVIIGKLITELELFGQAMHFKASLLQGVQK